MRRYALVFALFVLSMIMYIDRVCISTAKDPIARDLALSDNAMGVVFGAFALGYALAQIPSGWFADRFGPRAALASVVAAWSGLTALTGASWSFTSLVAIRFLFGVGEAGMFPGSARAICNWLPSGERGRANGVLFSGSRLGAAFSYPLLAWMLARWHWRTAFLILGSLGIAWAAVWLLWYRDPAKRPAEAPRWEARAAGFGEVFRSRGMTLAMLQYFASNFTNFIFLSWMLPYLKQRYHLSGAESAAYSVAPLVLGATAQWIAGWQVDRLAATPGAAVLSFALAAFGADMTISPSWVFCADIAGPNAGSVSGSMNMLGNLGAFVSANAFPYLQGLTGSASAYFFAAAALNLVGVWCWIGMKSVERESKA